MMTTPITPNEFHVWAIYGIDPETQEKHGIILRDPPDCATEAEATERFLDHFGYLASHCSRERWITTPEGVFPYPDPLP